MIAFSGSSRPEGARQQDVCREQYRKHEIRERAVGEVEEVAAAGWAAAGVDAGAGRECGRRNILVAQPVDERERLGLSVLTPAHHLHVQARLVRSTKRGPSPRSTRATCGSASARS